MFTPDKIKELRHAICFRDKAVADIGAIKPGPKHRAEGQAEPVDDIFFRRRIRCGGQGKAGNVWKTFCKYGQAQIFGTEIMSPLGDAMGFVNGEKRDIEPFQQVDKATRKKSFRCDIEELQCAVQKLFAHCRLFFRAMAGIECRRGNAKLLQCLHLILHQGDQR